MAAITRAGLCLLACGVLAFFSTSTVAADPPPVPSAAASAAGDAEAARTGTTRPDTADEPATLRVLNRDVVTLRARVGNLTPKVRVQRAEERLRQLPPTAMTDALTQVPARLGDTRGVTFLLGGRPLLSVVEGDVDPEARQSLAALANQTQAALEGARAAWHEAHDEQRLLIGVLRAGAATVVLGILGWVITRVGRRAVAWMEDKRDRLAARRPYIDWSELLGRLGVATLHFAKWIAVLTLVYWWLYFVLASFALTAPLAASLGNWLFDKLVWIGEGLLQSLPGLATVAVVLLITRALVDVQRYFFEAVQKGRLKVPLFHPETVPATRRIFAALTWALGCALAYPYLPGSSSEAFKGVSVLLGVMISLGSAGLITQAMSGLVIVYSRSMHKGDFVEVNGVQGVVTEVGALATKVINVRNEEITIPHSVVIANPIRNYTRLGAGEGTLLTAKVTIGYDAPWRQVHALLIGAALKTPGVRETPAPYVYQRALSDFYVEYELFANVADPWQRVTVSSALHARIQDEFNEHGVQIMSPHFLGQPPQPVVVPREKWGTTPARGE